MDPNYGPIPNGNILKLEDANQRGLEETWTDGAVGEGENPATTNSKSHVREPHVGSAVCMVTMEGIVQQERRLRETKLALANNNLKGKNKEVANNNNLELQANNKEVANKEVANNNNLQAKLALINNKLRANNKGVGNNMLLLCGNK